MPVSEFNDNDLVNAIKNETGFMAKKIIAKQINKEGNLEVTWR